MKKLVLASNNDGKIREVSQILKDYKIMSLKDINCDIDVEEDACTFEGNAIKKAREISKLMNVECIADDSGICVDALDGWPGIFTHRCADNYKEFKTFNELLLYKMKDIPREKRTAQVVCVMAYADEKNNKIIIGKGILKGKISLKERGNNGFGFDSVFELENGKTVAELTQEEKNKISARYLAILDLKNKLEM